MKLLLIFFIVCSANSSELNGYEGFKVYQALPQNDEQLQTLTAFIKDNNYDVWSSIQKSARSVDVMVEPTAQTQFTSFLQNVGIQYQILLDNVESIIREQYLEQMRMPKPANGKIDFSRYHTYSEIKEYLVRISNTYTYVNLETIGTSYEGRDIDVIKISSNPGVEKPIIFIDGGIHAREWISPATVLYIIDQLAENIREFDLWEKVDWHILPSLNPDGYSYTFTNQRMWRKTRSPNGGSTCIGTDPNRNFGFHWGGLGAGTNPCREDYRGNRAFSENETEALRSYISKIQPNLKLYLSFHSYGNYILYPWSYTSETPVNADELQDLGDAVAKTIRDYSGTKYTVGSSTNVLYESAGSSDDWVMGGAGVDLAYTIELPGLGNGFLLPPAKIKSVVEETWQGIVTFHKYVESKFGPK